MSELEKSFLNWYDELASNCKELGYLNETLFPSSTAQDESGSNYKSSFYRSLESEEERTRYSLLESYNPIRVINQYVLPEPLDQKELDVIMRDEAFKKQIFYVKGKFSHDKFAEHIRAMCHIKKINGQLHVYDGGIYIPGYEPIEKYAWKG